MPRILVIDGNVAATRANQVSAGGTDSGDGYAATLRQLSAGIDCDVVRPADGEANLPSGMALKDYSGAVITGSALNVYSGEAAVQRQIDLARAVFAAGVPCFGSCWGLQVGVVAAGGSVVRNPRGREFGFARRIHLTAEGRDHPMFLGKPDVFEAITVHVDTVESLPAGSTPLARNGMGLQAAEIKLPGGSDFWGVQYHPEYGFAEVAAMARRYAPALIRDGQFGNRADLEAYASDLQALESDPSNSRLVSNFGIGEGVTDSRIRLAEIRNWLQRRVLR